jgi:hypothetical protein
MPGLLSLLCLLALDSRVVVNEVMAHPKGSTSTRAHYPRQRNQFVELYNRSEDTIDLRGWRITDFDERDTLHAWTDTLLRVNYPHVRIDDTRIMPGGYALILDPGYTDPAPESGFVQPYRFTDRLLIVRGGHDYIGNGLAESDPFMLWSPDSSEVSTFGCFSSSVKFPTDAGSGISWERVSPDAPDCDSAWFRCQDTAGCTPGRANSVATYLDLALTELLCHPLNYTHGVAETIQASVLNAGRVPVTAWQVNVSVNGALGVIPALTGSLLTPGCTQVLTTLWQPPAPGQYQLSAVICCPGDRDTSDDRQSCELGLGVAPQTFSLQTGVFGPNLKTGPDTLHISYSLPDVKGTMTVTAYDLNGRERAVIFQGKPPTQFGALTWNGADASGRILPAGLYVIACVYKSGKKVTFEKKTVVLAKR